METILEMTLFEWVIFLLSISAYGPLIIGVVKNRSDLSQVATTWFFYFVLDLVTMFSTKKAGSENFVLLFGFSVGSFIIFVILLYQKRWRWKALETSVSVLTVFCLIGFTFFDAILAVVLGILSEIIIGIYLIIRTWKHPTIEYNLSAYVMFLISSILAMINANSFMVEDFGYALVETILCLFTIYPLYKKWREEQHDFF